MTPAKCQRNSVTPVKLQHLASMTRGTPRLSHKSQSCLPFFLGALFVGLLTRRNIFLQLGREKPGNRCENEQRDKKKNLVYIWYHRIAERSVPLYSQYKFSQANTPNKQPSSARGRSR